MHKFDTPGYSCDRQHSAGGVLAAALPIIRQQVRRWWQQPARVRLRDLAATIFCAVAYWLITVAVFAITPAPGS